MNLSTNPSSPWFNPMAGYFVVLLDGKKQYSVETASEDQGWVEIITEPGVVKRVSGQVELLLTSHVAQFTTPNFIRVANWLQTAGKEPGNVQHLSVQVGCMLEEVIEFIEQLELRHPDEPDHWIRYLQNLATEFKKGRLEAHFKSRVEALDALCDIDVTINGVAYLAAFNKLQADRKVLDANDDKFVDGKPVILPGGKIGKRDGWTAPDLSDCVFDLPAPTVPEGQPLQ